MDLLDFISMPRSIEDEGVRTVLSQHGLEENASIADVEGLAREQLSVGNIAVAASLVFGRNVSQEEITQSKDLSLLERTVKTDTQRISVGAENSLAVFNYLVMLQAVAVTATR